MLAYTFTVSLGFVLVQNPSLARPPRLKKSQTSGSERDPPLRGTVTDVTRVLSLSGVTKLGARYRQSVD